MNNLSWLEILVIVLATHRVTRLVVDDTFPPIAKLRDAILSRWPADDTMFVESEVVPVEVDDTHGYTTTSGVPLIHISTNTTTGFWPVTGHWLGDLVSCGWCVSVWAGGIVVGAWQLAGWSRWVWLVLAASTVTGLIRERVA